MGNKKIVQFNLWTITVITYWFGVDQSMFEGEASVQSKKPIWSKALKVLSKHRADVNFFFYFLRVQYLPQSGSFLLYAISSSPGRLYTPRSQELQRNCWLPYLIPEWNPWRFCKQNMQIGRIVKVVKKVKVDVM